MATTNGTKSAQNAGDIGWAFVPQYYTFVNKDPAKLHCFYTKESTLIHSTEGEEVTPCFGQQQIHDKFMSLGFDDCKVFVSNVDSQSSAAGGIIVQVLGEMSNGAGPWRKFAQTFFLAEQPNGFFVLNDIFRYLKEETDDGSVFDEVAEPGPVTDDIVATDAHGSAPPAVPVTASDPTPTAEIAPLLLVSELAAPEPVAVPEPTPAPSVAASVKLNGFHAEPTTEATGVATVAGETTALGKSTDTIPGAAPPASVACVPTETPASAAAAPAEPTIEVKPEALTPAIQGAASTAPSSRVTPSSSAPIALALVKAPEPAAPAAPKTWASLAASGKAKWHGNLSMSQGVSSAPPPPSPAPPPAPRSTTSMPAAGSSSGGRQRDSDRYPPIESITSGSCFIKGVNENVDDKILLDTLVTMFGPVKELDIVRNKACAFLEFEKVESAKEAIKMSMPVYFGGQGGIPVGSDDHIINIETKRQPGERGRPVDAGPKRGFGDRGRGGYSSGRGRGTDNERNSTRGRGRGSSARGSTK